MPVTLDWPFAIDEDYDHTHASNGSRYGNYLAARIDQFREYPDEPPTTDPARFAEKALRISLAPVMSPGYVRTHPRIQDVATTWDDDDRFAVVVTLAAPLPGPIAAATAGQSWHDWSRDYYSGWWFAPYDLDRPAAYTRVTVHVPFPREILPAPVYLADGAPDVDVAKSTVRVVCARVNSHLQPLFDALDSPRR